MKQIDQLNKGHDDMDIPYVEEILPVSIYLLLESMVFILIFLMESKK